MIGHNCITTQKRIEQRHVRLHVNELTEILPAFKIISFDAGELKYYFCARIRESLLHAIRPHQLPTDKKLPCAGIAQNMVPINENNFLENCNVNEFVPAPLDRRTATSSILSGHPLTQSSHHLRFRFFVYIDDILLASASGKHHLAHLTEVIRRLQW